MDYNQIKDLHYDMGGTSLRDSIEARYCDLEKVFGKPFEGDSYKVSGRWVFQDEDGNPFTLYDWKSTKLYNDDNPSVKEFRKSKARVEFYIGGRTEDSLFKVWLESKIANTRLLEVVK